MHAQTTHFGRHVAAALSVSTIVATSAQAAVLLPGDSTLADNATLPSLGALQATATNAVVGTDVNGVDRFAATVTATVYARSGGPGLVFEYSFSNDFVPPTLADSIVRFTATGFAGFTTDVFYTPDPTAVEPIITTRSVSGDVIGFNFDTLPVLGGDGPVPGGAASPLMYVYVPDATGFTDQASVSIIDGATAVTMAFAPIPEPTLISGMLLGAAGLMRRRR